MCIKILVNVYVQPESRAYKEELLQKDRGSFVVCEGCKLERTAVLWRWFSYRGCVPAVAENERRLRYPRSTILPAGARQTEQEEINNSNHVTTD